MNIVKTIVIATTSLFLLSGCAIKNNDKVNSDNKIKKTIITDNIIPYDGVVNMGQYGEALILPYKDDEGILYNARNINFWIIEPDFNNGINIKKEGREKQRKLFNPILPNANTITIDNEIIEYLEKDK